MEEEIASFNTQPRGGGCKIAIFIGNFINSFNTQPRGGGCTPNKALGRIGYRFQHTAARRRLPLKSKPLDKYSRFQHTAARRRLPHYDGAKRHKSQCFNTQPRGGGCCRRHHYHTTFTSFNTQPRGGGCLALHLVWSSVGLFQHTAARRRLPVAIRLYHPQKLMFQHTAARRRLQFFC